MRKMYSEKQLQEMIAQAKQEIITEINTNGVDKVNPQALVGLTHSFNELDETSRQIVQEALDNLGREVSCSEAQWNVIKSLLNNSLYLYHNTYYMVKTMSDGQGWYLFGGRESNVGSSLEIQYSLDAHKLIIYYSEV